MDTLSQTEQRDQQFEKINIYRSQFTNMNFPILSIDTKKKEILGNFCRPGTCCSQDMRRVNDPNFASSSDGQIVPHGIYDARSWQGVPFYNIQFIKELTDRTATSTGLKVYSEINNKQYQINRTVEHEFKTGFNNQIIFDDQIPKWNYLIRPA